MLYMKDTLNKKQHRDRELQCNEGFTSSYTWDSNQLTAEVGNGAGKWLRDMTRQLTKWEVRMVSEYLKWRLSPSPVRGSPKMESTARLHILVNGLGRSESNYPQKENRNLTKQQAHFWVWSRERHLHESQGDKWKALHGQHWGLWWWGTGGNQE